MLGRFFKSYSSSQSEKRLTINFRFSSAVCRARLRFLKCFIFEDFIIKIRCEIVWQSYAVAWQSKMTGKSWGRDQSSFLWCTTAPMAHVQTQKKIPEVDPISFDATSMILVWFQQHFSKMHSATSVSHVGHGPTRSGHYSSSQLCGFCNQEVSV